VTASEANRIPTNLAFILEILLICGNRILDLRGIK
jgi:hypothetical protein